MTTDGSGLVADKPAGSARAAKGKGSARSARRHSREIALQGLYQWLLSGEDGGTIQADLHELDGFAQADPGHLETLLHGCIREAAALDALIAPHIDRAPRELSPVEHVALMIGSYELRHCVDIPYRVVINEAVELTKSFGGTDGHKYVNGVLDKVAGAVRAAEVQAHRR